MLRAAGRQRGITAEADKLHHLLGSEQMRQPAAVEDAMGLQLQGLVWQLDGVCQALAQLEHRIDNVFTAHSDAKIMTSEPGLGVHWVPACWPRSATTGTDSPTPAHYGPSRALRR
ncbi:hypothetical protein Q2K16_21250 [Micromonospora sp. HUAS LYJ1]|nr:hypothetical protein [Micromonospora sp. HUAS LYJ1]WKU03368.1 hypothetical protein Q2K16_21250 [Micromonospora sp. HUAS LYJ1]